jgi:hypothetical protein
MPGRMIAKTVKNKNTALLSSGRTPFPNTQSYPAGADPNNAVGDLSNCHPNTLDEPGKYSSCR